VPQGTTLANRGAQTIAQRIAVDGVVAITVLIFHPRQLQLAGKLDAEQLA
jgi:hypothetical protein